MINRYVSAAVANWQMKVQTVALYKHYGKLVGDRTPKAQLSEVKVTEIQFVDNAALHTTSQQALSFHNTHHHNKFLEVASEVGLTVQRN